MRTRKGDIFMIYHSKTITLKDGQSVIFRNPTPEKEAKIPSLGVSTIIFWSLFRFGTATASINAGFFRFSKT